MVRCLVPATLLSTPRLRVELMPSLPKRACNAAPGCNQMVPCPVHIKAQWKRYDSRRGTSTERGYGSMWRKVRDQVLIDEPLCRTCSAAGRIVLADEVDHIAPMARGGAPYDAANLQSLCSPCHSAKTAREDGGFGNKTNAKVD